MNEAIGYKLLNYFIVYWSWDKFMEILIKNDALMEDHSTGPWVEFSTYSDPYWTW